VCTGTVYKLNAIDNDAKGCSEDKMEDCRCGQIHYYLKQIEPKDEPDAFMISKNNEVIVKDQDLLDAGVTYSLLIMAESTYKY